MFPTKTYSMPDGTAQYEYADGTVIVVCEHKHYHRMIKDACVRHNSRAEHPCDGCCTEYVKD